LRDALILGIETSCDETSAAVTRGGSEVLSNVIDSQIAVHRVYGGVVPEVASRSHIEKISAVTGVALECAGVSLADISAVAVSAGPGLVGALLTGLGFAKGLAFAARKPLIGVHHIEAHICANYIATPGFEPPFVALVVSGGHTSLVDVRGYREYAVIGSTRDDAAGEAFDKAARALGLPYPGGVEMDRLARSGDPKAIPFPRGLTGDGLDFSFSGLKSAVLNYINQSRMLGRAIVPADVAASFTDAVAGVLIEKAERALRRTGAQRFALAGGVAANSFLRSAVYDMAARLGVDVSIPGAELCTDNAAMVAARAYYDYAEGRRHPLSLNARPSIAVGGEFV
jgi:N6-L-threonylcarbamoyladenine synthase